MDKISISVVVEFLLIAFFGGWGGDWGRVEVVGISGIFYDYLI
jgi:hypothetical protein